MKIPENINDDTPLRLDAAARIAFPDGSMSGAALRRAAHSGKLEIECIAGKFYVTLSAIREMRKQCRVVPKVRVCGFDPQDGIRKGSLLTPKAFSSSMADARSALEAVCSKKPSRRLQKNAKDAVIPRRGTGR